MSEAEVEPTVDKVAKIGSSEMTTKVAKLLRQAESAPEGSPEREVFMERAMTLSQAYTIDLDLARAQTAKQEKVEEPEEVQYQTGSRVSSGRVSNVSPYLCDLMLAIGRAYNMKALISHSSQYVWLTGFPSDHKMVERLFALLSVQMVSEADHRLKRGEHKKVDRVAVMIREEIPESEREWGLEEDPDMWEGRRYANDQSEVGILEVYFSYKAERDVWYTLQAPPSHRKVSVLDDEGQQVYEEKEVSRVDGRVWRKSFYEGFITKTERRLKESRRKALADAGIDLSDASDEKGLVLLDKKEQIEDHFEKVVLADRDVKGSWKGSSSSSGTDWSGHRRGEHAATNAVHGDEVDLGSGS